MDDSLAARLATDLDGTFETLVLAHQDRLYSLALRSVGDPGEAEELVQDAFVRAYRALAGYEPERRRSLAIRPWLSTIVLNLCRNRARRVRPAQVGLEVLEGRDGVGPDGIGFDGDDGSAARLGSPEASALRREETETWARRVRALPARYRDPVLLRYVDDLAYAEISTALDIPEGTLRAQVHRGLALLRTALEHEAEGPAAERPALRLQEVAR
jgi:RNA polymerase sigma-70 factor (ECF subfamily)